MFPSTAVHPGDEVYFSKDELVNFDLSPACPEKRGRLNVEPPLNQRGERTFSPDATRPS